jgi:hypothetical protein
MRLGMVLTSRVYDDERAKIVRRSFDSLTNTVMIGVERPAMALLNTTSSFDYGPYLEAWGYKWDVVISKDLKWRLNVLQSIGAEILLADGTVTHLYFMYDDFIYNPHWLRQLQGLIERHPGARAWGVYRSSFTNFHRIIGGDDVDVLMTMHDGIGCVSREEWTAYQDTLKGEFIVPLKRDTGETILVDCTIDVHHAYQRPGERWATSKDYMQNIGVHQFLGRQDEAIDFVGE